MPAIGRAVREEVFGHYRSRLAVVATAPAGRRRQVLEKESGVKTRSIATGVAGAAIILALASCTNPYDPGQRAVGGGLLGAGAGAAIGGIAGGGHGAAIGAAAGGALGAVTGAATTPPPPGYYPPPPRQPPPGY